MSNSSDDLSVGNSRSVHSLLSRARSLLLLIGACLLSCLLVDYLNAPLLAVCALTGILGWLLYYRAGLNRWSVLVWCLATVVSYAALWEMVPVALCGGKLRTTALIGLLSLMASMVLFLVVAAKNRKGRGRNLAGVALALLVLVFYMREGGKFYGRIASLEAMQKTTQTLVDLHRLGNEVESLRAKLGRLPDDEEELARLQGKPMPLCCRGYRYTYHRINGDYYIRGRMDHIWERRPDVYGHPVYYQGPTSTLPIISIP